MERADLTTLRARRDERELKFAQKCASSERFKGWFPLHEEERTTRWPMKYREVFARCCRCYNSPIYSMRRRLNKVARVAVAD